MRHILDDADFKHVARTAGIGRVCGAACKYGTDKKYESCDERDDFKRFFHNSSFLHAYHAKRYFNNIFHSPKSVSATPSPSFKKV